ncbi:DUF4920 domain-containing protein [Tenacibaculum tangerinum]|uniref:DUF4920 domain-containing protein n=1 Tax=Tenacibaculum tangerinum TaxID=3038772 RepID=A0ABY8L0P9_9FLAO|nr:DUF4920 domain-containing protein [Tenacibaculum tangerinum]WGH75041.1 DUF4920 domain-containing protein [Tenacibaculum tangerinum]
MHKLVIALLLTSMVFISCKKGEQTTSEATKTAYQTFGASISANEALTANEMLAKFQNLSLGDTINVKFASTINEVCKKKGCWMKLDLGEEQESMVRFKDYGFFMPLNADSKEVIVNGKAYVTEISVDELQHYAKDAGKSEAEIAKITEPKYTYAFEADGVLMKK